LRDFQAKTTSKTFVGPCRVHYAVVFWLCGGEEVDICLLDELD
jgi:hypothetical protein